MKSWEMAMKEKYERMKGIMSRNDNVLNMQITIVNTMKEEWNMDYVEVSDLLDKYDLLSYINTCYEEYNSMGMKGILLDLKSYIKAIEEAGNIELWKKI